MYHHSGEIIPNNENVQALFTVRQIATPSVRSYCNCYPAIYNDVSYMCKQIPGELYILVRKNVHGLSK
jgi:hypothetical protein